MNAWHMHGRYLVAGQINPCMFGGERETLQTFVAVVSEYLLGSHR